MSRIAPTLQRRHRQFLQRRDNRLRRSPRPQPATFPPLRRLSPSFPYHVMGSEPLSPSRTMAASRRCDRVTSRAEPPSRGPPAAHRLRLSRPLLLLLLLLCLVPRCAVAYINTHVNWRPRSATNAADELRLLVEDVPHTRAKDHDNLPLPTSLGRLHHKGAIRALGEKLPSCVRPEMRGRWIAPLLRGEGGGDG